MWRSYPRPIHRIPSLAARAIRSVSRDPGRCGFPGQGRHVNHVHPAGWISSAFYVALPDEIDAEGPAGWLTLGEAGELGLDLPPIRLVQPRPGRLVLFPSTLWHGTRPFEAGERLTVAFDVARPYQ